MSEYQRLDEEEELEEIEEEMGTAYPYMVSVRFHNASRAYSFGTDTDTLKGGDQVIVETAQGMELGTCEAAAVSTEKFHVPGPLKPILRIADEQDKKTYEQNIELADQAYKRCAAMIKEMNLKMRLLSADYTLDRSKVLFVYLSDQRVDFRELLKKLGSQLHCRIELRQIGERDKAKVTGGIGMCGMECCCSRFKSHFDVISIGMAKTQLLALNVEKLSGQCGKLMCCLKYENEDYKKLTEGLPKMGAHVEYDGAMYRVTSMNVMNNEARIENSETVQTITIDDLRDKCVVRKGVAMVKHAPGRGGKRTVINNVNPEPKKVEDKLHETLHKQIAQQKSGDSVKPELKKSEDKLHETLHKQIEQQKNDDDAVNPVSYAARAAFAATQAANGVAGRTEVSASADGQTNAQNRNRNRNKNRGRNQNRNQNLNRNQQCKENKPRNNQKRPMSGSANSNVTVRSFKANKSSDPQGK